MSSKRQLTRREGEREVSLRPQELIFTEWSILLLERDDDGSSGRWTGRGIWHLEERRASGACRCGSVTVGHLESLCLLMLVDALAQRLDP